MHLHTNQKSALLETRKSDFSLAQIIELIVISLCLGKVKVFSNNPNMTHLVYVRRFHENGRIILCVSDEVFTLF